MMPLLLRACLVLCCLHALAGLAAAAPDSARTVALGWSHSCAVTTGGGAQCWGQNSSGQLGDGTTTNRATPTPVSGLGSGVAAIAAGAYHTCALTTGGGVQCWGLNTSGQLGDGTTDARATPTAVSGLTSGVAAIAAGAYHTCALTTGGGVQCWGQNPSGQLGDGTTTSRSTPTAVSGLGSGVAAIAVGAYHACALSTGGGVQCWGANFSSQLGDNTTTTRLTPTGVSGLASGVAAIASGERHTCALTTGGDMQCWGDNSSGQLGNNTTTNQPASTAVIGLSSGVAGITAGAYHTCAVTTGGGVQCWGRNASGQIGDNSATNRLVPTAVSGLSSGVAAIAAGLAHTCAVTTGGGVQCWGDNAAGQLGDGTTTVRLTPTAVDGLVDGPGAFSRVSPTTGAAGLATAPTLSWGTSAGATSYAYCLDTTNDDACAPWIDTGTQTSVSLSGLSPGATYYWHARATNAAGGTTYASGSATAYWRFTVTSAADSARTVSVGWYHTCALTTGGGVQCWGWNFSGQLGDGTTTDRVTPTAVSGLGSAVAAIGAGGYRTCALTTGGGVQCWGLNASGQLGDGTTSDRRTPTAVSGLSSGVAAIATGGDSHTCAMTTGGGVQCWGANIFGQLGDGTTTARHTPTAVSGLGSGVAAIAAGADHTCALKTGGGVQCWGANSYGQLGDGTMDPRLTPTPVSGLGSGGGAAIAAGASHTCAVTTGGGVQCWGDNASGQLGDSTTTSRSTPTAASGLVEGPGAFSRVAPTTGAVGLATAPTLSWETSTGATSYAYCLDTTNDDACTSWITTGTQTSVGLSGLGPGVTYYWHVRATNGAGGTTYASGTASWRFSVTLAADSARAAALGLFHTCALTTGGGVQCWGQNSSGQLGDGTTTARATPTTVSGLSSGVVTIAAGLFHTCALTTGGGVQCWGRNSSGQLGDGTTTDRATPTPVSGLSSGVVAIAASVLHTCALTTGGGVQCWGANSYGELGDGTTTARRTPAAVSGLGSGVVAIAANGGHTCAVTTGGGAQCWGANFNGQLGDGTTTARATPTAVIGLSSGVVAIAAGAYHTCALTMGGGVQCWGANFNGQLGDGTTTGRTTPTAVSGPSSGVAAIAAGDSHTCAVTTSGGAQCWGRNNGGQLGDGTTTDRVAPTAVSGLGGGVAAIAAGVLHTCAVTTGGGVQCWGANAAGQLGDGTTTNRSTPTAVSGLVDGAGTPNTAPTISDVTNQTIATNAATGALPVTVGDAETLVSSLLLTATSSNPTLVPNAGIALGGSGASRTVTVTPAAGQTGVATITLTVTDGGGLTATDTFTVSVTSGPVSGPFTRYLAEGATSGFFDTRLAILNPGHVDTTATLTFLRAGASSVVHPVTVPARTRVTVDPKTIAGMAAAEFSTTIQSPEQLVIDRTMLWNVAEHYGAHAETAIASPSPTWYLAEGSTNGGFQLFYLLQNPASTPTTVRVRYLRGVGAPLEKQYVLPANSRTNIWVNEEVFPGAGTLLAAADVSAVIESLDATPIIVERAMYLNGQGRTFNAGHESAGITAPATSWFLAEGATGPFFDLFVLVANPNAQDAQVRVDYLLADGRTYTRTMTAPANSRSNIWVDHESFDGGSTFPLADVAVSTTVTSTNGVPVIVERAMWWPGSFASWYEGHNSAGSVATGTRWALADGEVGGADNNETYILVANVSPFGGTARVTLMFEDGSSLVKDYSLTANSRTNVAVGPDFGDAVADRRFGAVVESIGATPAQIVVERAMYSGRPGTQWSAGTNALATRLQ